MEVLQELLRGREVRNRSMPMRELIRPTLRTIRWGAIAGAAVPAAYVVWNFGHQSYGDADGVAFGLRAAAVSLALGLAFVLDDPSEDTTAATPISVLKRRALRVLLTLPIIVAYWLLLRAWAAGASFLKKPLPAWPFVLEVFALAAVALAGAAVGARWLADRLGGPAGAGTVILYGLVAALLPWGNGLLVRTPGTAAHDASLGWWWLVAGLAAIIWWRMSATRA